MTETQFLNHEIANWGIEEVEEMLEKGYVPFLDTVRNKWTWLFNPVVGLTERPPRARVGS